MRIEPVVIAAALSLCGCVSHSIREDTAAVRALAAARADLDVVDRDPQAWLRDEPAVRDLLARPITVESAVRIALLNNRNLRGALYELGIARGELVQAGLLPNPTVDGNYRFVPSVDNAPPQVDIGIEIDVTGMILAPLRAEAAGARLEAARLRTAGAVLDLAYRVRLAFYRCQASAQQLELMRTALDAFVASAEAARALRDAGNVRDLDVAIEEAALEQARIDVARAELAQFDDRERLNVLLGLYGRGVTWEVEGRMADPPDDPIHDDRLEARAIEASIDLAAMRAELDAVGRSLGLARAEGLIPNITIGVHAEHDDDRWEVGPEATIRLPIFDQNQGNVRAREAELDALRERYVALAIAIRASVRAARNRAVATQLMARRYREVLLPARTRAFEQTLLQYNAMQVDVFRLLAARREQIDAAREYIDALRDHWQARATLEQVLAGRVAGTIGPDVEIEMEGGTRGRPARYGAAAH